MHPIGVLDLGQINKCAARISPTLSDRRGNIAMNLSLARDVWALDATHKYSLWLWKVPCSWKHRVVFFLNNPEQCTKIPPLVCHHFRSRRSPEYDQSIHQSTHPLSHTLRDALSLSLWRSTLPGRIHALPRMFIVNDQYYRILWR